MGKDLALHSVSFNPYFIREATKIEYVLIIVLIGLGLSVAPTQLGTATRNMTEHATEQATDAINESLGDKKSKSSNEPR